MFRTTVPKAAVHKDGESYLREYKIRFSKDVLVPAPTGNVVLAKKFHQSELRVLVPSPANPGHDLGAFCLGEDVRHVGQLVAADTSSTKPRSEVIPSR